MRAVGMLPLRALILLFAVVALKPTTVKGQPETLTRLTRPKVLNSEELKDYLHLVKGVFNNNVKARYGKRGEPYESRERHYERLRNLFRMILELDSCKRQLKPYKTNVKTTCFPTTHRLFKRNLEN